LNYSYAPLNTASLGVSGTLGGYSSVNGAAAGLMIRLAKLF